VSHVGRLTVRLPAQRATETATGEPWSGVAHGAIFVVARRRGKLSLPTAGVQEPKDVVSPDLHPAPREGVPGTRGTTPDRCVVC
jgi:hypothetical protein